MAGLIGSSNSPVSGIAILAVLGAPLLMVGHGHGRRRPGSRPGAGRLRPVRHRRACWPWRSIANDNLQDLKTGQLVDATPWKQQVALVIGVIAGSVVIPPVLELLNHAYGFAGAPNLNAIADEPLPAPQATLISTLAKGVSAATWTGACSASARWSASAWSSSTRSCAGPARASACRRWASAWPSTCQRGDRAGGGRRRGRLVLRPLGRQATHGEAAKRLGVLIASGLIVGESLFNVAWPA